MKNKIDIIHEILHKYENILLNEFRLNGFTDQEINRCIDVMGVSYQQMMEHAKFQSSVEKYDIGNKVKALREDVVESSKHVDDPDYHYSALGYIKACDDLLGSL